MAKSKKEKLGLKKELADIAFNDLLERRKQKQKELDGLSGQLHQADLVQREWIEREIRQIDESFSHVRDSYSLWLLEGLDKESRTLKWLTIALISLTAVLAIFTIFLWSGVRP